MVFYSYRKSELCKMISSLGRREYYVLKIARNKVKDDDEPPTCNTELGERRRVGSEKKFSRIRKIAKFFFD